MLKPAGAIRTEAERNLALLGYGLLGVSVFFAGVTALVAVIVAYALHDAATETLSSHFRFQIHFHCQNHCHFLNLSPCLNQSHRPRP